MRFFLRACLVLCVLLPMKSFAQQRAHEVPFRVVNNGEPTRPPVNVIVRNGIRSITLPIEASHIVIPADFATGTTLTIEARVGQDLIKIPGIPLSALESSWTNILADKSFGDDYRNALPKGTNVRSACLVVFDPVDGDGTVLGVSKCRKSVDK